MVPRAVASLVSYEAERRMMRASDPQVTSHARGLEETARVVAVHNFLGAPDGHAVTIVRLSMPHFRQRLRPARLGERAANNRRRGPLLFRR